MPLDALELQLAAATQRFNTLKRRAESPKEPSLLLTRSLAELSTALEEVRVAQEQLLESRLRMEQLQEELREQAERYWQLFDEIPQPYVVTRPDSTIVEVNKAASALLNVSQRFLVGMSYRYEMVVASGQFMMDWLPPDAAQADSGDEAALDGEAKQWAFVVELGAQF